MTIRQLQTEREKLRNALRLSDKDIRAMGFIPGLSRENIHAELEQMETELRDALRRRQARRRR